jgi:2-polyprenyl-3-methyl-5-hydroxy-6-metoxy-1,4-benzoquinol methylase
MLIDQQATPDSSDAGFTSNNASTRLVLERLRDSSSELVRGKYGLHPSRYMQARLRSGYVSPEDQYEALIKQLVVEGITWLDVGCGGEPFPNNLTLSSELPRRCRRLVGVDPDPQVLENQFVHERIQSVLEEYRPAEAFDLVTARMVVEHVRDPGSFVEALRRVTRPGSLVVIFTVNLWSITTLSARFTPMWVHHLVKAALWQTKSRDSFETEYRMNRRNTLWLLMEQGGFVEDWFEIVADASLFWRIPFIRNLELFAYRMTRHFGLPYIDSCILAIYRRL